MALKAGYKGIKKIGTGLKLTTEGTLSLSGSGPTGEIELNDLDDVAITEPANGNILVYDSADEEWKNTVPAADTNKADISAIGTNETGETASKAYAIGEHFYKNGKFCTAKAAIAQGATFTLNTNYVEGTVANPINFNPVSIVGDRLINVSGGYRIDGDRVDIAFSGDLNFDIPSSVIMPNFYTYFGAIGSDLIIGLPKPKAERVHIQVLASSGWTTYILHGIVYVASNNAITFGITSPLELLKSGNYKIYVNGSYYR